jgi:menaquinone-dependent protoporphyrinogen oxidase
MNSKAELLIIYASTDGQTARIARYLQETARGCGVSARVDAIGEVDPRTLADCDRVIVAAPVRFGSYPRKIVQLIKSQLVRSAKPCAFVSVSGSSSSPEGAKEAQLYVESLLKKTGWKPAEICLIAGAIKFTRYNPLLRYVMKRIAGKNGLALDTSRDYEYTDWKQLDSFVRAFVSDRRAATA